MQDNNHICIRCGYSTSHLVTFKRHLARKNICKNKVSDDSLKEEYIKYNIIDRLNQINPANSSANPANSTNNPVKITEFICDLCENTFSRKDSLLKHQHGRCKNKNNENMIELVKLLNEQLKEQKEQIKDQSNQIKELIKKTGITNIQQNIKLLSYGSTDISHLTDKDFLKCLNHSEGWACPARPVANFCIPHLIEKIHFNPKNPENHHRID